MSKVNPNNYIKQFPELSPDEIRQHAEHFNALDIDGSGKLGPAEILQLFKEARVPCDDAKVRTLIKEFDTDGDGTIDFGEFLSIFKKEKQGGKSDLADGLRQHREMTKVAGARGEREFAQEEVTGYVNHINQLLAGDPDLDYVLPICPDDGSLFDALKDGVVLCKFVNKCKEGTILEQVIVKPSQGKKFNEYSQGYNRQGAIGAAKSLGVNVINIGNDDIRDGTPHLVLGLVWQLVRLSLVKDVSLAQHPELYRLLKPGETLEEFLKLSPEQILLRWLNYHLENAGNSRRATNFTTDLKDSEILTVVLKQIAPECCTLAPLQQSDLTDRAELMLQESDKIGCRKFVTPVQIVKGHPKLTLAFVANLFNTRPGLEALTEAELAALDDALFKAQGTRLERQFCIWMNSYGVEPFVMDLCDAMMDGNTLLQMLDKIEPGSVDWSKVNKGKMNKFKAVANLDYALNIAKGKPFELVIVGISGADLYDRNVKLTVAVLWQLMRYDYTRVFKHLAGGSKIKDEQIIEWANSKTASKGITIDGFKDEKISDSKPLLTLIDVLKPETVDWSIYDASGDPQKTLRNAMYVLSIVRKYGGTVYALPEDIVERVPQMVMTVYASLMAMQ